MAEEVGPIQSFGGVAVLSLGIWGFIEATWMGSLTGIVVGMAGISGVAIALGEQGTGTSSAGTEVGLWQRIGGFTATVLVIAGAYLGGWGWGWLWAIGGYAIGMLVSAIGGLIHTRSR